MTKIVHEFSSAFGFGFDRAVSDKWITFDKFHEFMADGTIDMNAAGEFNIHLYNSSSNIVDSFSVASEINNELSSANGYTLSGKVIASHTWQSGVSSGETRFDSPAGVIWSASGGNLGNTAVVKFACIIANIGSAKDGTNKLVAYSRLNTSGFVVVDGNTLLVEPNTGKGYFEVGRV